MVRLSPSQFSLLCWYARRKQKGDHPLSCPKEGVPNMAYAQDYLKEVKTIRGKAGDIDRTEKALRKGMDQAFFEQKLSRLNASLLNALGPQANPYLVRGQGKRGKSYEIGLCKESIRFGEIPEPSKKSDFPERNEPEAGGLPKSRSITLYER